jgi:hypothetical protein
VGRRVLVVDAVWRYEHVRAFDAAGGESRLLVITRDASVPTGLGAQELSLEVMEPEAARWLLAQWAGVPPHALPAEADAVVAACGLLPLALAVAGARIRDGLPWADLAAALEQGLLDFLDHSYGSAFNSLRLSVAALPEADRARYLELAVFPEDGVEMDASALADCSFRIWSTGSEEADGSWARRRMSRALRA